MTSTSVYVWGLLLGSMDLAFPLNVGEWEWETIESLSNISESQYIEYKSSLHARDSESRDDWQDNIEREITAFANSTGGVIVFGVTNEGQPSPFELPEHEVKQSVTRLIQNTTPLADLDISDPIHHPDHEDRIVLVVRVHEATRKPVLTHDSAIYIRINDRKEPMSREQMEHMFIDQDRRQQSIRQLEMELDRFYDATNPPGNRINWKGEGPPDFHFINAESIKEVLLQNDHLYADEESREIIARIFRELRGIEHQDRSFGRKVRGYLKHRFSSKEDLYSKEKSDLKHRVDRLEMELSKLAEAAELDVKLLDE